MNRICIYSQARRVGKTTVAIHLADELARRGERVLVVDFSLERDVARKLGVSLSVAEFSGDLMKPNGMPVNGMAQQVRPGISVLFAGQYALKAKKNQTRNLALNQDPFYHLSNLKYSFDFMILDTSSQWIPRSNPFYDAKELIMPLSFRHINSTTALTLTEHLRHSIGRLRPIGRIALVPVSYDSDNSNHAMILEQLKEQFGHIVFPVEHSISMKRAAMEGKLINEFDPENTINDQIRILADHVAKQYAGMPA